MRMIRIKNIIFVGLSLFFLLLPVFVFALEINYPDFPGVQTPQEFMGTAPAEDIPGLWVNYITALATWSAGIIAVLSLIWGGIKFLISTGKPDKITEAKKQISSALLGFLIILTAYFVLRTMSPFFIDFTLPNLEKFSILKFPAPPSQKEQPSSIDTYIPFGRIMENIFQTYISNPEEAEQAEAGPVVPETLTRIQRINNILDAPLQFLPSIAEKTSRIRDLSRRCRCEGNTRPDPEPCGGPGCAIIGKCTCDPCSGVRNDIINIEKELNPYFFEDIDGIVQHDVYGKEYEITTNLTKEITKLEDEVRLLRIWFDRLAESQKFIENCDWVSLNNRNTFFQKKDEFEAKGWVIENVAFYDDLKTVLNVPVSPTTLAERWYPVPGTPLKQMADESTLYCATGGTYTIQPSDFKLGLAPPDPTLGIGEAELEDYLGNENVVIYEMACDITVPFGEVLDKAHRMARLFLNSMELILDREKRIVEESTELQILVSQCSSKPTVSFIGHSFGCFSFCIPPTSVTPCIPTGCHGSPCPSGDIEDRARNIENYVIEIQEASTTIRQIFAQALDLLQGMQDSLRDHMTSCTFEKEVGGDVEFYTCGKAVGATNEIGKMISQCDAGTNDQWQDTPIYGQCLDECFFKNISFTALEDYTAFFEETDYRKCVNDCMARACIYNYNHELNFQCCHYKK